MPRQLSVISSNAARIRLTSLLVCALCWCLPVYAQTHHHHKTLHKKTVKPVKISRAPHLGNHSLALVNTLQLAHAAAPVHETTQGQKNLVDFVDNTVYHLHYSSYRLGGARFDTTRGVYILDCSRFVDNVLNKVYPDAYLNLVNATGADLPATQHYYEFFSDLETGTDAHYWNPVERIGQLRPGDILVLRYKKLHGRTTEGHMMIVMEKPVRTAQAFFVRVADSAPVRHSQDTRHRNESGIGIGTLLLKSNPLTGKPTAYAWGLGGIWKRNVKFAMARPLKVDV